MKTAPLLYMKLSAPGRQLELAAAMPLPHLTTWDARQGITLAIASLLTVVGSAMYLRTVLRGEKAVPHVITWALLTVLTGSSCALQITAGEGLAALPLAISTCFNATNLALGVSRGGATDMTRYSFICAGTAIVAGYLWWKAQSGALAAIFLTIAGLTAFAPTVIRTARNPEKEPQRVYWLKTAQYLFVALAVREHAVETTLYPAAWFVANAAFSCYHYRLLRKIHVAIGTPSDRVG